MSGEPEVLPPPHGLEPTGSGASPEHAGGECFGRSADPPTSAAQEETAIDASVRQMRDRHSRYLGELIDRGHGMSLDMFQDASNRDLEHSKRVQFARLADRVCETTRKLIVTYDRHAEEKS